MNNDILIVIHRDKYKDMLRAMNDLTNYLSSFRNDMSVDKYRATVDICGRIGVTFRCGKAYKMAGIRPNYYQTHSREAEEFLTQSAVKCCGKRLDSLWEIANIIREEIGRNEI